MAFFLIQPARRLFPIEWNLSFCAMFTSSSPYPGPVLAQIQLRPLAHSKPPVVATLADYLIDENRLKYGDCQHLFPKQYSIYMQSQLSQNIMASGVFPGICSPTVIIVDISERTGHVESQFLPCTPSCGQRKDRSFF